MQAIAKPQTAAAQPAPGSRKPRHKGGATKLWWFLGPAVLVLAVMIVYPTIYSIVRSLFNDSGSFVGVGNYTEMFTASATLIALRNNLIWVLLAPITATIIGLILAVLMDKITWKTAFRLIIFMPMAISMLAAGIIFRSVFQQNPQIGFANAAIVAVQDLFTDTNTYPGARPREGFGITQAADTAVTTTDNYQLGDYVLMPLVGINQAALPAEADRTPAFQIEGSPDPNAISGVVWLDFAKGGSGTDGVIDAGEAGLAGVDVVLLDAAGKQVASVKTIADGSFAFPSLAAGEYQLTLPATNFATGPSGIDWLGPKLVTPVMILAFVWIWAGFAMVMIGAGLSAVDRSLMEAARTDGANEWQVFRHITVPQLLPTLTVVLVTLIINVLKIFDLVYVIPPGQVKDDSTVVAVEMWRHIGNFQYGSGSALAILLLVMVLPFMLYQGRNFRRGN